MTKNTTSMPKSGQPVNPSKQKFGRGGLPRLLPELANADSDEVIEAAKATARFVPFDPAFWVKCAETAQMDVGIVEHHSDLWLSVGFINTHHVDNLFLSGWLHETPDGTDAVKAYLEKRNASSLGRRDFLSVGGAAVAAAGLAGVAAGSKTVLAFEPSLAVLVPRYFAEIGVFNNTDHASDEESDAHAEATFERTMEEMIGLPARTADDALAALDWLMREKANLDEMAIGGSFGDVVASLVTAIRDYLVAMGGRS